jgi:hypothetical protein
MKTTKKMEQNSVHTLHSAVEPLAAVETHRIYISLYSLCPLRKRSRVSWLNQNFRDVHKRLAGHGRWRLV